MNMIVNKPAVLKVLLPRFNSAYLLSTVTCLGQKGSYCRNAEQPPDSNSERSIGDEEVSD
jgi:hypothetical protein